MVPEVRKTPSISNFRAGSEIFEDEHRDKEDEGKVSFLMDSGIDMIMEERTQLGLDCGEFFLEEDEKRKKVKNKKQVEKKEKREKKVETKSKKKETKVNVSNLISSHLILSFINLIDCVVWSLLSRCCSSSL